MLKPHGAPPRPKGYKRSFRTVFIIPEGTSCQVQRRGQKAMSYVTTKLNYFRRYYQRRGRNYIFERQGVYLLIEDTKMVIGGLITDYKDV